MFTEHIEALMCSLHFIYCYGCRVLVGYVEFLTISNEWKVYINVYFNCIMMSSWQ